MHTSNARTRVEAAVASAMICALLIFFGEAAVAASPSAAAHPQARGSKAALISIESPGFNSVIADGATNVKIHLGAGAVSHSFHAEIDGADVTSLFSAGHCGNSGNCDMHAALPASMLHRGTNILTARVAGPNDTADADRVNVIFDGLSANASPVARMLSAVSVKSVYLPAGANSDNVNSYQILVGPGPGFAQQVYTTGGLNCGAGINSMHVLVLSPSTMLPDTTVASGKGQACESDSASLSSFLRGLPKDDIVIMNEFSGNMSNIDTTPIGGTAYAGRGIKTLYYNAIGLAGGREGMAHESYQTGDAHTPREGFQHIPPLEGSLILDNQQKYYFAPSSYPVVKVSPGASRADRCAHIDYDGGHHVQCVNDATKGGFFLIAIDRLSGDTTDAYDLRTNNVDAAYSRGQIQELAWLLTSYYKSNDLLIMTTYGTPIANVLMTEYLWNAISNVGGNAYRIPQMTSDTASYTLLTAGDRRYASEHKTVQLVKAAGDTDRGPISVQLSKSRLNQFEVNIAVQDASLTHPFGFEWTSVAFQQPTDWPAWTAGQLLAYADLTSSDDHYHSVREDLGCSGTGTCQPIRTYYSGGIGTAGTMPAVLHIDLGSLGYYPNPSYTNDDFEGVIRQLAVEQGYARNVYTAYALFKALATDGQSNLQLQLKNVADTIDSSVLKGTGGTYLSADLMAKVGAGLGLLSAVPGIGPAAGAAGTVIRSLNVLAKTLPDAYTVTLDGLKNNSATIGADMSASINTLFAAIVQDWGKLSTIGAGYGSQQAPWYMCSECVGSNVPVSAIPMLALEAKRQFYRQLMPTVFSSDYFFEMSNSDPRAIKRLVINAGGGRSCNAPYGRSQTAGYWSFPNFNVPAKSDIYTITETKLQDIYNGAAYKQVNFPSSALLNDLFSKPTYERSGAVYRLGGGAGLVQDDMMQYSGYLTRRQGYLPGSESSLCQ